MIVHSINGKTYETVYAHLKSYNVKIGQRVKAGDCIGYQGNTGGSVGQHLHFELHAKGNGRWNNKYTNAVDPLLYLCDPAVKEVQELLNKHGYKLKVDGIKGSATTNAIKNFQKKVGIVADGNAGPITLNHLKKPVPHSPITSPSKNKGDEDELKFSSPALQKETEFSLQSKAHREMIVKMAIKAGANKSVWEGKLKSGEILDGDLLGLAVKYLIAENK